MSKKKRAGRKKLDIEQLDLLATQVNDNLGGDFDTFVTELRTIQKAIAIKQIGTGGTRVNMAGITGTSMLGGRAGQWGAMTNWANAARRAVKDAA